MITAKAKPCGDGRTFLCRKDWRKREWPCGENNEWYKTSFRRRFRRKLKHLDYLFQGNSYKKTNCHYDINDFK